MLKRRELLLGLPLLGAAGAAFALTPRERLTLLGKKSLEDGIPKHILDWSVSPSNAVILPEAQEGTLAARLYDQTVSRLYLSPTNIPVMMVIAYGSTQSDQLQLHRPEVCYQAVGFEVSESKAVRVPLNNEQSLPARQLVARNNDRTEPILYWTRIGDFLPASGTEQRLMKLRTEFQGYVADGVLVRLSTVAEPVPEVFETLKRFASALVHSADPLVQPALVGRPLAAQIAGQAA